MYIIRTNDDRYIVNNLTTIVCIHFLSNLPDRVADPT